MLRTILFPICLSLGAAPALSQDFATQYSAAVRAFTLPGLPSLQMVDRMEDDTVIGLLPKLEGDWVRVDPMYPDPFSITPELMEPHCERFPTALVRNGARSFEMRHTRRTDGEPILMTVHHDFTFGNSFDRSVREDELIRFHELEASGEVPLGGLVMPQLRGPVLLFHPSADILVFASTMGPIEFYARCS